MVPEEYVMGKWVGSWFTRDLLDLRDRVLEAKDVGDGDDGSFARARHVGLHPRDILKLV